MKITPAVLVTSPIGARPRGVRLDHRGDSLLIWFAWRGLNFATLLLAGVALAVVCLLIAGSDSKSHKIAALIAAIPALAGIALGLAGLLNHTVIEVTPDFIRTSHGPLGWPRPQIIPTSQVLQLYTTQIHLGPRGGTVARLWAAMENVPPIPLTWYMLIRNPDSPTWIEAQLESKLNIVDRPILCPACGYDLRVTHKRCPECGTKLGGTKRQRKAWRESIAKVLRDRSS